MSSANNMVSTMAAYLVQGTAATSVSNVTTVRDASRAVNSSFDMVLNKVSDTMIQNKTTDVSKQANQSLDNAKQVKANTSTTKIDENRQTEITKADLQETNSVEDNNTNTVIDETEGAKADTKLQEAINEAGKELVAQFAEELNISEDDVVNAMQILGLMAVDLLNPANIAQMLTQISGQEETIDLITDTDIYTSLQDLMEGAESMKDELMNEFDLSEEELQAGISDAKEDFGKVIEGNLNAKVEAEPEDEINENVKTATGEEAFVNTDKNTKTGAPQSEAFTDRPMVEEKKVEITTNGSKEGGNKNSLNNGAESSNLFNQVMNNIADAAVKVDGTDMVSYTDRAQMENIIRQITEKITISAKAEETSMELQLHPASLGNVNILLTSGKDGIVAKFTAQNTLVKEAVEAQMVQLQQKFDEQGIKVTSIEVTIASHGFEQNLEQGNERQSGEAGAERKVKPLRRINLGELDEDETIEAQSDAERIALQMMAANGNMVDFSA
ncbi:flagellar hook-length control protein FliK [Butyrivibrio sp. XPD2006]|uniref:flagellar hook-length control protein FliK n=1 Tax=Butyrivibrio sp. XPD2006 TaxID=1280668 RepID=UPI0003B57455|nr:flagellar hook-length control protein FliK [Butyrivibrio sp. XPD2006]